MVVSISLYGIFFTLCFKNGLKKVIFYVGYLRSEMCER